MRFLFALLLAAFSSASMAVAPLRIDASFDIITRGVKIAELKEHFIRVDSTHYRIESLSKPVGLLALFRPDTITAVSEGEITPQGLRPLHFVYKRNLDTDKNTEATFDWTQESIMMNDRYGQHIETLPQDSQDRLSALYQFRYISFLRDRKTIDMHVSNGGSNDQRQYQIQSRQMLTVPLGTLETLYLATPPQSTAWKTEIWLSIENGNFPCQIRLTEDNGDQFLQVLTALSISQ